MTEQALRECPHCGSKPVRKAYVTPSSPCGPAEYDEEIYCDNEECKQLYMDDIVAHWNTRAYDTELEELRNIKKHHEHLRFMIQNQIAGLNFNIRQIKRFKDFDFDRIQEINEQIKLYNALLDLSLPDFAPIAQTVEPVTTECGGSTPPGRKLDEETPK